MSECVALCLPLPGAVVTWFVTGRSIRGRFLLLICRSARHTFPLSNTSRAGLSTGLPGVTGAMARPNANSHNGHR